MGACVICTMLGVVTTMRAACIGGLNIQVLRGAMKPHLCLHRRCSHIQLRLQHLPWSVAAAELAPQLRRHTLACPAGQQYS